MEEFLNLPDLVLARTDDGEYALSRLAGEHWEGHGVRLSAKREGNGQLTIEVLASKRPIFDVKFEWQVSLQGNSILGDAWERAYGDLGWQGFSAWEKPSPWYLFAQPSEKRIGPILLGVKTGACAIASWSAREGKLQLRLDLRSGSRPLRVIDRRLHVCSVVSQSSLTGRPFALDGALHALCDHPRLAAEPIYGVNDWYYAYGHNTADQILDDSKRAADWAAGLKNRPFSVIDDGWEAGDGTWNVGNDRFPDMPGIAEKIAKAGCRPGLWVRPLLTDEKLPDHYFMAPKTLDPSRPEALEKVRELIRRVHEWGFELIKHDYSTYDVCGLWGFQMTDGVVGRDRTFTDDTRTTAEILRALYQTIREAAGSSMVLGCNTVGHLAAGLEEAQRIGDDTSGREWARTVKMGVNSLAYRGPQQGAFFEADPDCVPITTEVSWKRTRQWLNLVASSGTVLFVSAQKEALGPEQGAALTAAFAKAATRCPLAVPVSDGPVPMTWKVGHGVEEFDWR